jgi:DNA-3-methyladenine glycosylase
LQPRGTVHQLHPMKLQESFYLREDTLGIARELLGKVLVTNTDKMTTAGIITETEAYCGITDRASHAYGNRKTQRTQIMYRRGGTAYVYLCYGIHHLFNVVTHAEGVPHAVLIRACEPVAGIDTMLQRRGCTVLSSTLTSGPGAMSKALGITTRHTGISLLEDAIFIEDSPALSDEEIVACPRIGVGYAGPDALLPYRFYIQHSKFVSRKKG